MPEGPGAKDAAHPFTDEERASGQDVFGLGERERRAVLGRVGENLTQVRRHCTSSESCTGPSEGHHASGSGSRGSAWSFPWSFHLP
jgi:hypothetical protein